MRARGTERSQASPGRKRVDAATPVTRRTGTGAAYLQRAADTAAEVVDRLRHPSAEPVIQRKTSYAPLKPELGGQNDVAVLQKDGYHISIVDRNWSYQFDEFHVTEEVGPGRDPHFFFSDTGAYKKSSSWNHGQTNNYWDSIGRDEDEFTETEDHAKSAAASFLKDLKATLAAETPATAASPAATPGPNPAAKPAAPAAKPTAEATKPAAAAPQPAAKPLPQQADTGWTDVGAGKRGRKGKA